MSLTRKLHRQAIERGHRLVAENWAERARDAEGEMNVVRDAILRMEAIAAAGIAE